MMGQSHTKLKKPVRSPPNKRPMRSNKHSTYPRTRAPNKRARHGLPQVRRKRSNESFACAGALNPDLVYGNTLNSDLGSYALLLKQSQTQQYHYHKHLNGPFIHQLQHPQPIYRRRLLRAPLRKGKEKEMGPKKLVNEDVDMIANVRWLRLVSEVERAVNSIPFRPIRPPLDPEPEEDLYPFEEKVKQPNPTSLDPHFPFPIPPVRLSKKRKSNPRDSRDTRSSIDSQKIAIRGSKTDSSQSDHSRHSKKQLTFFSRGFNIRQSQELQMGRWDNLVKLERRAREASEEGLRKASLASTSATTGHIALHNIPRKLSLGILNRVRRASSAITKGSKSSSSSNSNPALISPFENPFQINSDLEVSKGFRQADEDGDNFIEPYNSGSSRRVTHEHFRILRSVKEDDDDENSDEINQVIVVQPENLKIIEEQGSSSPVVNPNMFSSNQNRLRPRGPRPFLNVPIRTPSNFHSSGGHTHPAQTLSPEDPSILTCTDQHSMIRREKFEEHDTIDEVLPLRIIKRPTICPTRITHVNASHDHRTPEDLKGSERQLPSDRSGLSSRSSSSEENTRRGIGDPKIGLDRSKLIDDLHGILSVDDDHKRSFYLPVDSSSPTEFSTQAGALVQSPSTSLELDPITMSLKKASQVDNRHFKINHRSITGSSSDENLIEKRNIGPSYNSTPIARYHMSMKNLDSLASNRPQTGAEAQNDNKADEGRAIEDHRNRSSPLNSVLGDLLSVVSEPLSTECQFSELKPSPHHPDFIEMEMVTEQLPDETNNSYKKPRSSGRRLRDAVIDKPLCSSSGRRARTNSGDGRRDGMISLDPPFMTADDETQEDDLVTSTTTTTTTTYIAPQHQVTKLTNTILGQQHLSTDQPTISPRLYDPRSNNNSSNGLESNLNSPFKAHKLIFELPVRPQRNREEKREEKVRRAWESLSHYKRWTGIDRPMVDGVVRIVGGRLDVS